MESLTKKEALDLHKKMWNILAEDALKGIFPDKKKAIMRMDINQLDVSCLCFCCEYAMQRVEKHTFSIDMPLSKLSSATIKCTQCPVKWGSVLTNCGWTPHCMRSDSYFYELNEYGKLYNESILEKDRQKIHDLCIAIAELPERKLTPLEEVY